MSQIKQLTPKPGTVILAVKVPEGAHDFAIGRWLGRSLIFHNKGYEVDGRKTGQIEIRDMSESFELELLGKPSEITEVQLKEWFPHILVGQKQCFKEWLFANEVDPNSVLLQLINQ